MPLNIDWQQILLHLLNFLILFAVLYFVLYKPVKNFMKKREDYYKAIDDKAEKKLSDAESLKKDYENHLSGVNAEINTIREQAMHKANDTAKKIVDNAHEEADRIIAASKQRAKYDADKIINDAEEQVKKLAISEAQKIILESTASESFEQFLASASNKSEGQSVNE